MSRKCVAQVEEIAMQKSAKIQRGNGNAFTKFNIINTWNEAGVFVNILGP